MLRAVAKDPVAQAKLFWTLMTLFFEVVLGMEPPLDKEFFPAARTHAFEDALAASTLGGCFGHPACATGPIETQGRGS